MTPTMSDERLHAFLDGELDPEGECEVALYLEKNPGAAERLRTYALHTEALRQGLARTSDGAALDRTRALQRRLARRLALGRAMAWARRAAAVAVLLAGGWFAHGELRDMEMAGLPTFVQDAAAAHILFSEDPTAAVVWTSQDVAFVERTIALFLGRPVEVPPVDEALSLVGVRLRGHDGGELAQLIYEDEAGNRVSLLLSSADAAAAGEDSIDMGEVDVTYWSEGGVDYAIVAGSEAGEAASALEDALRT